MEGETCCDLMVFWTKFLEAQDNSLKVRTDKKTFITTQFIIEDYF